MERPAQRYFCNKCGYIGNVDLHSGCGYLAYHLAPFEQNYIDQLERELALLKASPASASVAAPDYRIADRGFRWDAENRQHIPQLLIEFTPVPANEPNDSKGWKDRDSLAAMLAAAPTPPVSEDKDKIIAAANALENIASTSSSTRIRRVANAALTAIRARRNHG